MTNEGKPFQSILGAMLGVNVSTILSGRSAAATVPFMPTCKPIFLTKPAKP